MKKIIFYLFIALSFSCKDREANDSFDTIIDIKKDTNPQLLIRKLANSEFDTLIRNKSLSIADNYYKNRQLKDYFNINKAVLEKAQSCGDTLGIITTNYNLGIYYLNTYKIDSSYFYLSKAEKLMNKFKNKKLLDLILLNKSNVLWSQKNYVEAEKKAFQALNISVKKQDVEQIYLCYITIANSLFGLNDHEKALIYYNKALNYSGKIEDLNLKNLYKIYSINYIAKLYQEENKHQKVVTLLEKSIDEKELKELDAKLYCYVKNVKNYSKFKLGDDSSVNQFYETLKIADSLNYAPIQITSKTYLGEFYLKSKDSVIANSFLKEARKLAHENTIFEDELQILKLLAKANPQLSSYYSDRYIKLNDSLQIVERAIRDKFARIEYETDEITTERNSLTLEKEYLSSQRLIILEISIFSIIIIVLWFMNKSQKAKTRELLLKQEQQKANEEIYQLMIDQQQKIEEGKNVEKQRISLELHDGVMGKLSAVRLNLYASLYKANLIEDESFSSQIDEIQAVEQEIRNIAHDLNSNLFSDNSNFIAIVKELFAKIENHSQIQFTLHVSDAVNWDLINNNIKINIYRILQEALQNIEKYANAKKVAVIMTQTDSNEIKVTISDDGNGFNTRHKKDGIGIKNMKIRIEELRGTFDIQSEIKKGTKINLIIPF